MGSLLVAPLARALISLYDWRTAMFALGCIAWFVVLPVALLLRRPPAVALGAGPAASDAAEFTVAQALRSPQFTAIALTHFACCAAHSGPIFHMVSYAIDCGVPAMAAATVFGTAGLSALGGRVVCGLTADRIGVKPTLLAGLTVQAVAISLYLVAQDAWSFYALAALFGFSYGGVMPLYAILVREYFGARIMGTLFGAIAMISTLGMAIGPLGGGWLYDAFGGYFWLYISSAGIGLGAVAIALTTRPPEKLPVALAGAAHGV
jgi:predicted MFS family arabinose efflux permease